MYASELAGDPKGTNPFSTPSKPLFEQPHPCRTSFRNKVWEALYA